MFPCQVITLPRRFPMYVAFPHSEYYQRVRLPPPHPPSYGWSFQSAYSAFVQRLRWISQVPNASLSFRAVLSDPAGVSGNHRLYRLPTVAFHVFDHVGPRMSHEAQSLHLRYGPDVALSTLSP